MEMFFMKTRSLFSVFLIGMIVSGCATADTKMVNTSPQPAIPETSAIEPIPATVVIDSDQEAFIIDVSLALQKHTVFTKVVSAGVTGDLELFVSSTTQSNHYFADGMGKAVISGLSYGLASYSQVDPYDFSITVKAQLKKGSEVIAEYETIGSYHSEIVKSASITAKTDRVKIAVLLSYEHALTLLAANIKQDRKLILKHLI